MSDKVRFCTKCGSVEEFEGCPKDVDFCQTEEVEVIPVEQLAKVEAERDTAKKQRDDLYIEREECWKTIDRMAEQRRLVKDRADVMEQARNDA